MKNIGLKLKVDKSELSDIAPLVDLILGHHAHILKGIEVSDETLLVDLIRQQGIGGQFLDTDHTAEHFRRELFRPTLADRQPLENRDMVEAARAEADRIIAQTPVQTCGDDLAREINRLFAAEVARRSQCSVKVD
jgi:trimethylamine--corrinoid protein Co-methyltransferase